MLSLKEVRRAAGILGGRIPGMRLQRVVQPDNFRLILELYRPPGISLILLSCRPQCARLSMPHDVPKAPKTPPSFAQYLRAHAEGAFVEEVAAAPNDRLVRIRLGPLEIVLSILGARSNIYLLGRDAVVLGAMRPLSETRRSLAIGRPWTDPEGGPKSEGEDRWAGVPDSAYLEAIEDRYSVMERSEEAGALGRRLESAFQKEMTSLERKAVNILQDLGDANRAEDARRQGELLKLVIHTIPHGAESVTVPDYASGDEVVIPLDPQLTPAENLAVCFKRYQKAVRGAKALREHLESVRTVQGQVADFQQRLCSLTRGEPADLDALQALAAEPRARKLLSRYCSDAVARAPRKFPIPQGGKEIPGRLRPRRYKTEDGFEVWVGRSEEGNDYLTTRLARGNDLFFHLVGYPGSHVILRTGGVSDPPPESLLCACELAVHFSKLKESRHADVHVAPVKNVKKARGAKPGLVFVTRGKTIHLRRDKKRLENILESRMDDGDS